MEDYPISDVLDLTPLQNNPPPIPEGSHVKHKIVRGRVVIRKPQDIIGIVVHQTAIMLDPGRQQVILAGGDALAAKHRRALNVAAHVTAFTTGTAVYANPLLWYCYSSNGFNPYTYAIETEGLYCGLKGRIDTAWGKGSRPINALVKATIRALRTGLRFIFEKGVAMGSPLEWVYAHRQSSSDRRSDPGEEIWGEGVLNYAVPVLGLKTNPTLWLPASNPNDGHGSPLPPQWDPGGTGRY